MPDNSTSVGVRVTLPAAPGNFGKLAQAVHAAGAQIGATDVVHSTATEVTRDVQVLVRDQAHGDAVAAAIGALDGFTVEEVTSRVLRSHEGGAIGMRNRMALTSRDDLSMAYTPGVARVCMAIHHDFDQAWEYTIKANSVMVVSDGSDVAGVGDVGAEASLPACEVKALFLRELAGIDAFPLPVDARDVAEIVETVALCSSVFAGIHLTDISSPRCFAIQEALAGRLDVPVLHDDLHGTAVAVLAALRNALTLMGKRLEAATIAVTGQDTVAGVATVRLLHAAGVSSITGDSAGADALVAFAGPVSAADLAAMNAGAVVLSMRGASVAALDAPVYASSLPNAPNQVSASLAYPGIWKGALEVRATTINDTMCLAAADAIAAASHTHGAELTAEAIVPSVLTPDLVARVAAAVSAAADATGVARTIPV